MRFAALHPKEEALSVYFLSFTFHVSRFIGKQQLEFNRDKKNN